jgi:nucleoside-diphosphate-sugar epimerase
MYLVTGGAGFIGSHIVRKLVAMKEQIRVLDNFHAGKMKNLQGVEDHVEIVNGDILDQALVTKSMQGGGNCFAPGCPKVSAVFR